LVRSENSFKTAAKWLVEAETTVNAGAYNSSMMCSYLVMFHSARAILYRDGYREKSHYCVARYLEERYVIRGLEEVWIDLFDHYRELRHRNQYDVDLASTEKEARDALDAASRFFDRIKQL
jgi:uncharacterized protein (UPF0332 family)